MHPESTRVWRSIINESGKFFFFDSFLLLLLLSPHNIFLSTWNSCVFVCLCVQKPHTHTVYVCRLDVSLHIFYFTTNCKKECMLIDFSAVSYDDGRVALVFVASVCVLNEWIKGAVRVLSDVGREKKERKVRKIWHTYTFTDDCYKICR